MVSEWGSGENPSDSKGKRPLQDVMGGQSVSGARSTAMGQKPREMGICHSATGGAMFQKPREMGQTGTWAQAARLPLRAMGLALAHPQPFADPPWRAQRHGGGDHLRPAQARLRGGGCITVASRSRRWRRRSSVCRGGRRGRDRRGRRVSWACTGKRREFREREVLQNVGRSRENAPTGCADEETRWNCVFHPKTGKVPSEGSPKWATRWSRASGDRRAGTRTAVRQRALGVVRIRHLRSPRWPPEFTTGGG